ncbi:hypothetical protein ACMT3M_001803, partial [Campylobacter jejuni]
MWYMKIFKDYQKFTPYGLDFRLYSKDFITKLDLKIKLIMCFIIQEFKWEIVLRFLFFGFDRIYSYL